MWGLLDCTHYYYRFGQTIPILKDATLAIEEHEKVAVLAPPGHGKTTIVRLLTGMESPESGRVLRCPDAWPLGYAGGFRPEMTAENNIRSIAKMAGMNADELSAFVHDFSELGDAYYLPLLNYTNRMKARLGFGTCFGIPAKVYIADDKLTGGEPAFREKCTRELEHRLQTSGLLCLTSNPRAVQDVCDRFYVMEDGGFTACDDFEEAKEMLLYLLEEQDSLPLRSDVAAQRIDRDRDDLLFFDLA
ncbi:ATP-binding cassette domain-containing protein [Croceicoccus ponticola]|nr:ATP-binding cassette domain-containing protein [Croceicoccus ponticola]